MPPIVQISLSQLPADVLFHILDFCGLLDNLSFSMVCKANYALSTERMYWISALENERLLKPIACPRHEDLTQHDLSSLRRIVLHTVRLQQNWLSEKPQVMAPVKMVPLTSKSLDPLFKVPGTQLFVFHCPDQGTAQLWDMGLGKMICEPIGIAETILDSSPGEDLPGRFSMALLAGDDDAWHQIAVISVEYGPLHATLSLAWTYDLAELHSYWAIFLDKDVVGVLCYSDQIEKVCITAINRRTKQEILIPTDIPAIERLFFSGTTIINGDLCLLFVDFPSCSVFTVPSSFLPRNDQLYPRTSNLTFGRRFNSFKLYPQLADESSPAAVMTSDESYGVLAMSVVPMDTQRPDVKFWVPNPDTQVSTLIPLSLQEPIPGNLHTISDSDTTFWQPMVQTQSGRKGLVISNVVDSNEDVSLGLHLWLVGCEHDSNTLRARVVYRDLPVPGSIDLSKIHGLFLDDHLGVVTMIDSRGVFFAVSYA